MSNKGDKTYTALGLLGALWGLTGVSLLLGSAVCRLFPLATGILDIPLLWYHWLALAGSLGFMGFYEGYKGFQKGFSPRVAARLLHLCSRPTALRVILAPVFGMGFFHATKKRKIVTWCLTLGIIGLILLVRQLPQPWRGIIDAGVVLGLTWGLLSFWFYLVKGFLKGSLTHDPEVSH